MPPDGQPLHQHIAWPAERPVRWESLVAEVTLPESVAVYPEGQLVDTSPDQRGQGYVAITD